MRPGKPVESCVFDEDHLKTTIHLGVFIEDNLIGVCSFFKNSNPNISENDQYQLRGMAVLKSFQAKGYGGILLNHGENLLIKINTKIIWCNAREIAVNYYKKNGYQITGESFNIKDIGLHYVMHKVL